jgi:hypothetical protein
MSRMRSNLKKVKYLPAIYSALMLLALVGGLVIVLSPDANTGLTDSTPVSKLGIADPTPVARPSSHVPAVSGNHTASNANATNRQRGSSSGTNSLVPSYPTLAPVRPLSQTVNGYTVTLYPWYANANRIVLTYTVQSSYEDLSTISPFQHLHGEEPWNTSAPPREVYIPRLTSDTGSAFRWLSTAYWQIPRNPRSSALVYDARDLVLPPELKLHLELNLAEVLVLDSRGAGMMHTIKGPFRFDFSLPVDRVRRIAEVNKTATTRDGDTLIIERAIVTRYEARVVWRLDKSNHPLPSPTAPLFRDISYACCSLKLVVGPQSVDVPHVISSHEQLSGDDVVAGSLMDWQGDWLISASYYVNMDGQYVLSKPARTGLPFYHAGCCQFCTTVD